MITRPLWCGPGAAVGRLSAGHPHNMHPEAAIQTPIQMAATLKSVRSACPYNVANSLS